MVSKIEKLLKFNYNFNPILQNRIVLYFFFFLAIMQIVLFIDKKDMTSLAVLLITGFLTQFFSKNMIVILCIALAVTNILKYGTNIRVNEGFEDNDDDTKLEETDIKDELPVTNNKSKEQMYNGNYEQLKKEYPEFKEVQQEILNGINKMDPLLKKAEQFMEKFTAKK